jgi:hypothetical protein
MPATRYAQGHDAWGLCQKCGLRFFLADLVFDKFFPALRVCRGCYDPKQPQEFRVEVTDPQLLYKPSPEDAPDNPILTAAAQGANVALAWQAITLRGGARVDAYLVERQGVQIASLPVTYYDLNLADLVENGDPREGNDGIASQTLSYVDTPPTGQWIYQVIAQLDSGRQAASNYQTVST